MKLLYDLEAIGILNSRIKQELSSIISVAEKNRYCERLIDRKNTFTVYVNQCTQLNLSQEYETNWGLQNIDLIDIAKIEKLIKANIPKSKKRTSPKQKKPHNASKNGADFKSKKKRPHIIFIGRSYS